MKFAFSNQDWLNYFLFRFHYTAFIFPSPCIVYLGLHNFPSLKFICSKTNMAQRTRGVLGKPQHLEHRAGLQWPSSRCSMCGVARLSGSPVCIDNFFPFQNPGLWGSFSLFLCVNKVYQQQHGPVSFFSRTGLLVNS